VHKFNFVGMIATASFTSINLH